jgi:hypothetical protein
MSEADTLADQLGGGVARTWGPERAADPDVEEAVRTAAGHLARVAAVELDLPADRPDPRFGGETGPGATPQDARP